MEAFLVTDWEKLCVLNTTRDDVNLVPIILSGSIYVSLDTFEHQSVTCGKIENLRVQMLIGILLQEFGLYF